MVDEPVFWTSFFQQKKTLGKLIEESHAGSTFYVFLSISAFITTLGLLLDNPIIVIGGMLVAPLLFPILSLAMGVTTSNIESIMRSISIIFKSVALVFFIAFITTFLLGGEELDQSLVLQITPNLMFFLVALTAGFAAAYSWVKQNLSATLPGVAISVTLIPPLCAVGIALHYIELSIVSGSVTLFLLNLLGIVVAGLVTFSLFGFSRLQKEEKKLIQEERAEHLIHKKAKLEKTKENIEKVEEKIEKVQAESIEKL